MSITSRTAAALNDAWDAHEAGRPRDYNLPQDVQDAVDTILERGSAPNRQYLLAIAAGTAEHPESNPASLQLPAGIDRRGQAGRVRDALAVFRAERGLTLKISQDAGVSNQWREREIDDGWVSRRRARDVSWASSFLVIVTWLSSSPVGSRKAHAAELLKLVADRVLTIALGGALDYPRFQATPKLAMELVRAFIDTAPDRPDATEAVVAVAARAFAGALATRPSVTRRDINSPDPIDVLISSSDGAVSSGIEVTDEQITLRKIEHEVVPAMLRLGLDRATVVSRGVARGEVSAIEAYVKRAFTHFQQRIDLETVDVIESWLSFPGSDRALATDFLWGVGVELDSYSGNENRQAWFRVLTEYASSV